MANKKMIKEVAVKVTEVTSENFEFCWMKLYQQRVFDIICNAGKRADAFHVDEDHGVMTYKLFELIDGMTIDLSARVSDDMELNEVILRVDIYSDEFPVVYISKGNDACRCINKFREYALHETTNDSICQINKSVTKITRFINGLKKKMKAVFN